MMWRSNQETREPDANTYTEVFTDSVVAKIARQFAIPDSDWDAFRSVLSGAYIVCIKLQRGGGPYAPGEFATMEDIVSLQNHLEKTLKLLRNVGVRDRLNAGLNRAEGNEDQGWLPEELPHLVESIERLELLAAYSTHIDARGIMQRKRRRTDLRWFAAALLEFWCLRLGRAPSLQTRTPSSALHFILRCLKAIESTVVEASIRGFVKEFHPNLGLNVPSGRKRANG